MYECADQYMYAYTYTCITTIAVQLLTHIYYYSLIPRHAFPPFLSTFPYLSHKTRLINTINNKGTYG